LYELCTGNPPHFDVSPLRAIFLISSKPAPKLPPKKPLKTDDLEMNCDDWSDDLKDFIGCCLKKDVNKRSSAVDLLEHSFIADYVSLIMDNEDRYLDSYDSDSSCGSEEALGLSVLLDLVEDNLPALKDCQRIRQESKSGRLNVLQANNHLLADGDFIANKNRTNLGETLHQNNPIPANPILPLPLSLPLPLPEKRPPLTDVNSARRDSKPVPTPVPVMLWSEDRPNVDYEWMYGGDSDPLQSTFMRKPDPVSLTDTFRPSAQSFRGSKLTPPRASFSTIASQESPDMGNSMIITPSSSNNSNSNGNSNCNSSSSSSSSSKGANIQSALRQFKETEDTITSKKLAALPPLSACERTHISPRTSLSARGREMQFVDTLDNLTMCTSLSPPRRKSGIARNICNNMGSNIGIGLSTANGTEPKDQKPFFLTALETTPRRPSSRDVLKSLDLPPNSTTSTTTTTLECTESFFRVDRSAELSQRDLGPWKPVPDATHVS
jgi:serine/threonine protein kinase